MSPRQILKSWKEIAAYLGVGIRTAQRWSQERGLPVRRPGAGRERSAVLALPAEIDRWLRDSPGGRADLETEAPELAEVVVTDVLWKRQARPAHLEREVRALLELGRLMAEEDQDAILRRISMYALELCRAESSGFSLLETAGDGAEIFRWTATSGRMKAFEGGTTPADFSPCGVCLGRDAPQLFRHPERLYSYLRPISPIAELLLIPIHEKNAWVGTIWVLCHERRRQFDSEDARLMMDLGSMAAAVVLANRTRTARANG
jgi:hypothetical protein